MVMGLFVGDMTATTLASSHPREELRSPLREEIRLEDRRRPWEGPHMTVLWKATHPPFMPLEALPPVRPPRRRGRAPLSKRLLARLASTARWLCDGCALGASASRERPRPSTEAPPRKWYRVHPTSDARYLCRPDAGMRGKVPGAKFGFREEPGTRLIKSHRWRRSWSVPDFVEREMGVVPPPGFYMDAFRNCCRICYEQPVEVVMLPCRHGAVCELCLRRHMCSRPVHKGGRKCPFCRQNITEVVRICREAVVPMYGYAIKVL
mmetsp:Transcript_43343/g.99886  ORF Transcript_43343/g.99886 Transcript_43343/m.99886 type:complete len:264 (+) Transcript_43343:40-831(+)